MVASITTKPLYFQPALVGGLVIGVLSALPIIQFGNCCCLWVVSGGVIAAYLLQQQNARSITPGDGALVGLLAGIVGCIVWFVVSIPIAMVTEPMVQSMVDRSLEMAGQMPPDIREILENVGNQRSGAAGLVGTIVLRMMLFFVFLFISAIFSTLGGLLGAAVFAKRLPPGTIDVPPSTPL